MRRVSAICSNSDFEIEERREALRNIRWARRRSQLITVVFVAAVVVLLIAGSPGEAARSVSALLGL